MNNILLVGSKAMLQGIDARQDLPCKLLVINDGFKALVGILKLSKSDKKLDGIYLHHDASRMEVLGFICTVRALEKGLGLTHLPMCVAAKSYDKIAHLDAVQGVSVVAEPTGETPELILNKLVEQLTDFVGKIGA